MVPVQFSPVLLLIINVEKTKEMIVDFVKNALQAGRVKSSWVMIRSPLSLRYMLCAGKHISVCLFIPNLGILMWTTQLHENVSFLFYGIRDDVLFYLLVWLNLYQE